MLEIYNSEDEIAKDTSTPKRPVKIRPNNSVIPFYGATQPWGYLQDIKMHGIDGLGFVGLLEERPSGAMDLTKETSKDEGACYPASQTPHGHFVESPPRS